ncbi:calcium-binding and coiled-coil domain-containing protein 2 [Discoglossus pictus]
MDFVHCGSESPPTSLNPPESCNYSQVVFSNMQTSYKPGTDIECHYTYSKDFKSARKDWVGIYKVGWKTTREYYTWVSTANEKESLENKVMFKAYYLPKQNDDYYQFCYVDENGLLRGASICFQFCHEMEKEEEEDILLVTTEEEALKNKEQLKKSQETILELEEKLSVLDRDSSTLEETVSSLNKDIVSKAEQIGALQANLEASDKKTEELLQRNKELKEQLDLERKHSVSTELKLKSIEEDREKRMEETRSLQAKVEQCEKEKETLHLQIKKMEKTLEKCLEEYNSTKVSLSEQLQREKAQNENLQGFLASETLRAQAMGQRLSKVCAQLDAAEENKITLERQLTLQESNNEELLKKLEEKDDLVSLRIMEIEDLKQAYQKKCYEIEELYKQRNERGLSAPFQQTPHLFFGNPYEEPRSSIGMQQHGWPSSVHSQEVQGQGCSRVCPVCSAVFKDEDVQVFNDHVMCHEIE